MGDVRTKEGSQSNHENAIHSVGYIDTSLKVTSSTLATAFSTIAKELKPVNEPLKCGEVPSSCASMSTLQK